jgi:hypothetical protein
MMRVLLFAAFLTASACTPHDGGQRAISGDEVSALRQVAEEACRCARSSGDTSQCWTRFRERTQHLAFSGSYASACFPVSTALECYNETDADGGFCISTGHTLVFGDEAELCSEEEARTVEAIYAQTLRATGDDERALDAASAAAGDLIRGVEVQAPNVESGCGG